MVRLTVVLAAIVLGSALQGEQHAAATELSDYRQTSAAINVIERSGTRLAAVAAAQSPESRQDSASVYAGVVVTEASLDFFIGHAGHLVTGDHAEDLQSLSRLLEELKALKDAKADLLGTNGDEAQRRAFTRARSAGEEMVQTARHLRSAIGCLDCDTTL